MQLKEKDIFAKRYRLVSLLGEGGFSEVWRAVDTMTGLTIALKVYSSSDVDDVGFKTFSSEFSLVFNLQHNNLLKPTFFDVYDKVPYLVLPFCEAGSINRLIGKINEMEAWQIMYDVASALEYLHSQEPPLIHQDIKPGNIMFGQKGQYQLADFGISIKANNTPKNVSERYNSTGTFAYMGPERFIKQPFPVKAYDIFSLGATMFELITGDVPFGEHGGMTLQKDYTVPDLEGFCSKELEHIIVKCLEKETWSRPTAEEIKLSCLQYMQYMKGKSPRPPKVEPDSESEKANTESPDNFGKRKSHTRKYFTTVILLLIACALAGVVFYVYDFDSDGDDNDGGGSEYVQENAQAEELYREYVNRLETADAYVNLGDSAGFEMIDGFELFYIEALDNYNSAIEYRNVYAKELEAYSGLNVEAKKKKAEFKIDSVFRVFAGFAKIAEEVEDLKKKNERNYALRDSFILRAKRLDPTRDI